MAGMIMQGPVFEALDVLLNTNVKWPSLYKPKLQAHLADLSSASTWLPDLLVREKVIKPGSDSDKHLRNDWFPDPKQPVPTSAWWYGLQRIENVTKLGYISAIQTNLGRISKGKKPLRFDSYWVCVPDWDDSDPEYFQVVHLPTPRQITVIVFTPPEPGIEIVESNLTSEKVFVTKRPGDHATPRLRRLQSWTIDDDVIDLYQVWRLHNRANERPAKKKASKRRRSRR
jgi:hypothetical protein